MKAILGAVSIVLVAALLAGPADAGRRKQMFKVWLHSNSNNYVELAQSYDNSDSDFPISESEAADIAQSTQPGAKVLKVRLLPSGVYAVTLKESGNVSRVMVNARTGDLQ